jgi:hypothetical protein
MVSGVTVAPRRPRTVPNQSNAWARSKLVARSPIPGLQMAPGQMKVGVVFCVESWMSASMPAINQLLAIQL